MELHQDFRDLLAEFADEKVEFLVIGGYAVAHYDRPRYTKDIDLWLNPCAANIAAASKRAAGRPQDLVDVANLERAKTLR